MLWKVKQQEKRETTWEPAGLRTGSHRQESVGAERAAEDGHCERPSLAELPGVGADSASQNTHKVKLPFQIPHDLSWWVITGFLLGVAKVNFSSKTTTGASRVQSHTLPSPYGKGRNKLWGSGFACWQIVYTGDCLPALLYFCET